MSNKLLPYCSFFAGVLICTGLYGQNTKLTVTAHTGYQNENFDWSIAGNLQGQNPNVLSELIWKEIGSLASGMELQYNVWRKLSLRSSINHSFIFSGSSTDTDYDEDNRTSISYRSLQSSDKGFTNQFKAGLDYEILDHKRYQLALGAGYTISAQKLFLTDDADLNSTYHATWPGFYIRAAAQFDVTQKVYFAALVTYHQVNYRAEANWNIVEAFAHPVSFRHTAKGYGVEPTFQLGINFNNKFSANIAATRFSWSTGSGIDELYMQTGEILRTKFNDADRNGFTITIGLQMKINDLTEPFRCVYP